MTQAENARASAEARWTTQVVASPSPEKLWRASARLPKPWRKAPCRLQANARQQERAPRLGPPALLGSLVGLLVS